ncbi:MAG: hypothetical protein CM1200mP32_09830 [Methanobacteriota archaeon]|nr:MAG: hypothetical protein CM1200mP32_09830 [Euryarchaeota archaeon]
MPRFSLISFDNVHLTWLDNYNDTRGETIVYTRLKPHQRRLPSGFPL